MILIQSSVCNGVVLVRLMHDLVFHRLLILLSIAVFEVNPALVRLYIADHVDVGTIDILKGSPVGVDSNAHRTVNTRDFYTVTGPHLVYKILISTQMNGLRRFSLRYRLWSLLHFNVLFVRKETQIVIKLESMWFIASLTQGWLNNLAFLDESAFLSLALLTDECCLFHFGNDVRAANYNTSKRD